jgi:hypothetical protein
MFPWQQTRKVDFWTTAWKHVPAATKITEKENNRRTVQHDDLQSGRLEVIKKS